MGPEKPIRSEEARSRAERSRQEALLRLQRNKSLKVGGADSQSLNAIRPTFTTQSNFANAPHGRSNLPRTISAPSGGNLSKVIRASVDSKSNVAPVHLKRPAPSGSSNYSRGAKVPSFGVKTPIVRTICVLISRKEFEVQARYHAGLIAVCKSLPTRVYDENTKRWHFNLSDYREFLKRASGLEGISLEGLSSAVVTAFKSQIDGNESAGEMERDVDLSENIPQTLNDSLLGFQREGVKFALKHDGRVLLADDMGLGKTLQSLAIASAYRSEWPLLIVTQLSLRCAWREAVLTWLGPCLSITSSDIYTVESLNDALNSIQHIWSRKPITIFTYDLVTRYVEKVGAAALTNFKVVIMDESHNLKNMKASRTQAALPILKAAKRAILLTGTPALSRPMELYSQLVGLRPNLFRGGLHEFGMRYCDAKETAWGWDYKGCSNLQELQILLQETVMIRRLKSEVANQLPPKSRHVKLLDVDPAKKLSGLKTLQPLNLASLDINGVEKHGEVLRLFKETCQSKVASVKQYVTDLLESGRKCIIYAHHQEMLDALSQLMDSKKFKYVRIDGKTSSDQRGAFCDLFQTSSTCCAALLSITAASTGLNLTASNLVVFAELYWNPGVLMQAEDRAHRIGQTDSVEIHYLLASGTVDEQLWSLVKNKLDVLSQVGLNTESFDNISLTHVRSKNTQPMDRFLTNTEKPPQVDRAKQPEKENQPETKSEVSEEMAEHGCKKTTARISLLPPISDSPANCQSESSRVRSSEILVPESPPSTEATDTLDDGADDLLLCALEAAVLDESIL
nr:SWI:SNF matrix associated [Hymenolepis microstoma]